MPRPDDQDSQKLLQVLDAKIATMERLLGNLHATEVRSGDKFTTLKVDLRARLTACYLAKRSLKRGEFRQATDLDQLLKRLRVQVEHRRFRALRPIRDEDLAAVDLDHLIRRLGQPSE